MLEGDCLPKGVLIQKADNMSTYIYHLLIEYVPQFACLLRLSKCQSMSPQTVLLRSTYTHPDDHNLCTYGMTSGFKPFTVLNFS